MYRKFLLYSLAVITIGGSVIGGAQSGNSEIVISQKNRQYAPKAITIKSGERIKIINDDIFLHHAFVDAPKLKFDSGSMEEGYSAYIEFKKKGYYDVLCAIHPKMKLQVTVE